MDNTTAPDEVTNVTNCLLVAEGTTPGFRDGSPDTASQAVGRRSWRCTGHDQLCQGYDNVNSRATLNLASALPDGLYQLFACGTATLRDLAGNALAGNGAAAGTDFLRNFSVAIPTGGGGGGVGGRGGRGGGAASSQGSAAPLTGFAPGRITDLSGLPVTTYNASNDVTLEVPALKLSMPVVGIPMKDSTWDVNWLLNQAGWLEGSAFPGYLRQQRADQPCHAFIRTGGTVCQFAQAEDRR